MAPDEGLPQTPAFAETTPHPSSLREATLSHKGRGEEIRRSLIKKGPGRNRGPIDGDEKTSRLLVGALLERGTENVAQRRPRIGGAVLRDGLLLFGDFQCLDGDLHLAGLLVELD